MTLDSRRWYIVLLFTPHRWSPACNFNISLYFFTACVTLGSRIRYIALLFSLHRWSPAYKSNISLYFFTACVTLGSRRWYIALLFPLHGWSQTPESGISLKGAGISAWTAYILAEWIFVSINEILGESNANSKQNARLTQTGVLGPFCLSMSHLQCDIRVWPGLIFASVSLSISMRTNPELQRMYAVKARPFISIGCMLWRHVLSFP